MRPFLTMLAGVALAAVSAASANAFPVQPNTASELVTPVAQGCGPGWWRGPWGHCRDTPYYGPTPGGGFQAPPGPPPTWNGCAPGYWRGPWGHCRDTPYHGPLPGGGWQ